MAITTTNFAKYTILPGILPRMTGLFSSGFGVLASVIAVLYYNIGLLSRGHPYLDHKNHGKFGIRHVVAEAGKNLTFSRKEIDKVVLYFTILIGLIILALQLVLLAVSLFSGPVFAGAINWFDFYTVSWTSFFTSSTIAPSQDIAFVVLDQVFGAMQFSGTGSAVGFFDSCISDLGTACLDSNGNDVFSPAVFPTPFHLALHQLLAFYSLGIGFVAGIIILYFIVAIIGETATSGTPFGRRLNKAWFIPRLIVFFALVAPLPLASGNNDGLNIAQLITLSVAKFGSNMATNAWIGFVRQTGPLLSNVTVSNFFANYNSGTNTGYVMLSVPNVPELASLAQFMYIVRMCMYAEGIINGIDVYPWIVRPHSDDSTTTVTLANGGTQTWNNMGGTTDDYLSYFNPFGIPFSEAVEFSRYQDVILRFGHRNPPGNAGGITNLNDPPGAYEDEFGFVEPTCGEIKFEVSSLDPFVIGPNPSLGVADIAPVGVQEVYWDFIDTFVYYDDIMEEVPYCMLQALLPYENDNTCITDPVPGIPGVSESNFLLPGTVDLNLPGGMAYDNTSWITVETARTTMELSNAINKATMLGQYMDWNNASQLGQLTGSVDARFLNYYDNPLYINSLIMPPELEARGWVGAALWYNKLAEINGIYSSAVENIPRPYRYPKVMEEIASQHMRADKNASFIGRFNPRLASGELAKLPRPGDQYIAAALFSTYEFWNSSSVQETSVTRRSNNAVIDAINMILGTHGIFDIVENKGTYPLAMLSGLGRSMVDAAMRNIFAGVVGQGIGQTMDEFIGGMAKTAGSFTFRMGMIGMGIGFVLFYVLPLLPFIYFFFAFAGWVKSIFEAVLAMPLWALAHIKLDGEGLPGPWATNGYFLLFEIFLRPILIIFGFIFSVAVFAALVDTLHNSYELLALSASGFDIEAEINHWTLATQPRGGSINNFIGGTAAGGSDGGDLMTLMRGPIDEIFYSVMYVIIVYMIGLSTFKLVDLIPNNIMRWMGVTVSTFHDTAGDPASELSGKMYRSVNMTNAQIMGVIDRNDRALSDSYVRNLASR